MNQEINRSNPETKHETPNFTLRRIGAVVCASAVLFGGVKCLEKVNDTPQYSKNNIEWTAGYGQGLDAAVAHIKNSNEVDNRALVYYVENMPENKKALENGLQQGEEIEIPASVSP
jgi:hypothetical protein